MSTVAIPTHSAPSSPSFSPGSAGEKGGHIRVGTILLKTLALLMVPYLHQAEDVPKTEGFAMGVVKHRKLSTHETNVTISNDVQ